ncbi:MAG: TonB-dependent receptor [Bacteroidales bacterium]|nr:TonB-dependent receptor [Bacteroidales bacterium]
MSMMIASLIKPTYSQNNQEDTVRFLLPVTIQSTSINDNTLGLKVYKFDSLTLLSYRSATLDDLLRNQSPIEVISYGPGSLSTISFRGTSSNHTGLFWNGISINPPNNGMTDISLLPVAFFSDVEVQFGGSSPVFGNGNIGGSIHLNNELEYKHKNQVGLGISVGSFHDYRTNFSATFSNEQWNSSTALFFIQAKNDFPYQNPTKPGQPDEKVQNAARKGVGLLQSIGYNFNNGNLIDFNVWLQQMDREIPSSMISVPSQADQFDRSLRALLKWTRSINQGYLLVKTSYLDDFLHYTNVIDAATLSIDSKIHTKSYIAEGELKKQITENLKLGGGVHAKTDQAIVGAYDENKNQLQSSIFIAATWQIPKINWTANMNIRQGWSSDFKVPLTPSVGFEGELKKWLAVKVSISKNFRLPTMNERYWVPGGNIELQPEISWNEEVSLIISNSKAEKAGECELILTLYNSNIDDWILWLPNNDTPDIWSPVNIQKVWARGLEIQGETKHHIGNMNIQASASYAYTKSTNEEKINESYKKQLMYVPEHSGNILIRCGIKNSFISYSHVFTGDRYVLRDNSEFLPAHNYGKLSLTHQITLNKYQISLLFDIGNLWNKSYQIVQNYPMPGRSYKASIIFKFSN